MAQSSRNAFTALLRSRLCAAGQYHSSICSWALNRGLNVYCEQPLGIAVEEVRMVSGAAAVTSLIG